MRAKYLFLYCTEEECLRTFHYRRLPFTASSITVSQRTQYGTSWWRAVLNTQEPPACGCGPCMLVPCGSCIFILSGFTNGTEDEKTHGTTDPPSNRYCMLQSSTYVFSTLQEVTTYTYRLMTCSSTARYLAWLSIPALGHWGTTKSELSTQRLWVVFYFQFAKG